MALQSSGQISISDIVAEKGATAGSSAINISLHGLSVDGVSDYQAAGSVIMIDTAGSPNQSAPYAMSEFYGYTQINTHEVEVSFGTPVGKLGQSTGTITSGANVPFGTTDLSQFGSTSNNNYLRMIWLTTRNDSWTSVETPTGVTYNRTDLTENGTMHGFFPGTSAQVSSWASGTWTFTYS